MWVTGCFRGQIETSLAIWLLYCPALIHQKSGMLMFWLKIWSAHVLFIHLFCTAVEKVVLTNSWSFHLPYWALQFHPLVIWWDFCNSGSLIISLCVSLCLWFKWRLMILQIVYQKEEKIGVGGTVWIFIMLGTGLNSFSFWAWPKQVGVKKSLEVTRSEIRLGTSFQNSLFECHGTFWTSPLSHKPVSGLGFSTNELMSWIMCVWLRRHAKCAVMGAPGTDLDLL